MTFNMIISEIFPENFIEIHHVDQMIWGLFSSIFAIFANFLDFFDIYLLQKTNDVSI